MKKIVLGMFLLLGLLFNPVMAQTVRLTSGNEQHGVADKHKYQHYVIHALAGDTVKVDLYDMDADGDLYVRIGSKAYASTSQSDCHSWNGRDDYGQAIDDSCSVTLEQDADVYIAVYAYNCIYNVQHTVKATVISSAAHNVVRYPQNGLHNGYVVYYPNNAIKPDMPVVVFLEGGGSGPKIDDYRGVMQFMASKGYFVIGAEQGESYDSAYGASIVNDAINTAINAHGLSVSRLAVMGHSQGGGQAFYVMKDLQDKGYGSEGSLILSIDGWFAFSMNQADLGVLKGDVAFLQMNGVQGTGTDPRIHLSIWNLLSGQTSKSFYILPENNHGYVKGDWADLQNKADLRNMIEALTYDAFNDSQQGAASIPAQNKTTVDEIQQALKPENQYAGDCKGIHYNARNGMLNNNDIDYCAMVAANSNPVINTVSWEYRANYDYYVMKITGKISAPIQVFLDTDGNSATGYTNGSIKGADRLLEIYDLESKSNRLYTYTGNGNSSEWSWDTIYTLKSYSLRVRDSGIEVDLARYLLGLQGDHTNDGIRYRIILKNKQWTKTIAHFPVGSSMKPLAENPEKNRIGARPVSSTPIEKGTLFASPNGAGDCSKNDPCSIYTAFDALKAGDVLFLRGGTYNIIKQLLVYKKGTAQKPVIIESYPGEWAVIKGKFVSGEYAKTHLGSRHVGIKVIGEYAYIRKLEVMHMGYEGIKLLYASHNIVEGCKLHNNLLPGVVAYGGEWHEDSPQYSIPYKYGYNIIRDNIVHDNSDVGLGAKNAQGGDADGGNADGIAISSGKFNRVIHNTVYHNSDDGIDTWRSNDSYVAYNLVYDNGLAQGDGNGIKAGGNNNRNAGNGLRAVVEHNISFANKRRGFDFNSGINVVFRYNTSYKNKLTGFKGASDTRVEYNVSYQDNIAYISYGGAPGTGVKHNSWQGNLEPVFISLDPGSKDFLRLSSDSPLKQMGAYSHQLEAAAKIFVIGDSTTYNKDFPDGHGSYLEMGWAQQEALGSYMRNPANLFDEGRSGASSKAYKTVLQNQHDWEETKQLIKNSDITDGAYLLIQFGHNDEHLEQSYGTTPAQYYNQLKDYIDWAKANSITPILITPVERRAKSAGNNNHRTHITAAGDYAQTVRNLANDTHVTLLDLEQKSWQEYNQYRDTNAINAVLAYDDNTHFSPKGAKIVAGWVKELICQNNVQTLCAQFK